MEKIAKHYGLQSRYDLIIEEMAELTQAISKLKRGKPNNVIEEIADVKLVLDQIVWLMDAEDEVDMMYRSKIERQHLRMAKEGKNDK